MKYSRTDYLARRCTHREYYAQFVDGRTRNYVAGAFGTQRLSASRDPHLNDIPMNLWDALVPGAPGSSKFRLAGDNYTLASGVCMLKEAARQILDESTEHSDKG